MSVDQTLTDSDDQSVEELIRKVATRVAELESQVETLKERVKELESQPRIEWDNESPTDIQIYHPHKGFSFPLGNAAVQNLPSGFEESDLQAMKDDIESLKRGEVSATELVGGIEPKLPIEEAVAKANDETLKSDLSANELRAVHVFRKFGGRSDSWSGTMTIQSSDVKQIIKEVEGTEPNPNTVKRTMKMLAKKTSDRTKRDREANDKENNLLYTAKGDRRLQLKADRDEWLDYMEEVEERYSS